MNQTDMKTNEHISRRGHGKKAIAATLAVFGLVALAATAMPDRSFAAVGGCHQGPGKGGHIERITEHVLDDADASDAQRAQVQRILKAHQPALDNMQKESRQLRQDMQKLLSAATIDHEAVEKLRQKKVAHMDQSSREMTAMLVEVAEVLTPEQRQVLAQKMQKRMKRFAEEPKG